MKSLNLMCLYLMMIGMIIFTGCGSDDTSTLDRYDVYQVEVRTNLNVRSGPSKRADKLFSLSNGTQVYVIDIADGWAHIDYHGQQGYVSADYITLVRKAEKEERDMWYADGDTTLHDLTQVESNELQAASNSKLMFVDSAHVLTEHDKVMMAQALIKEDQHIVVYTCDSVPIDDIYSYVNDKWDEIDEHSWYEFNNDMILILYARDQRYLALGGSTRAIKYIHTTIPERYFAKQYAALSETPGEAILGMEELLMESIDETNHRFFLKNWSLYTTDLAEGVINTSLVQCLLPTDHWPYKYIYSWLTFIPMTIAKWLMCTFGSLFAALIALSLIFAVVMSICYHYINKTGTSYGGCIITLLYLLYFSTGFCFSVFMDQSIENILVMQHADMSQRLIDVTLKSYLADAYNVSWLFCILLFVIMLVEILLRNHVLISWSFLPKRAQISIIEKTPDVKSFILNAMGETDGSADISQIYASDNPMLEALGHTIAKPIVEALFYTLPSVFVLPGQWLYFMLIFTGTRLLISVGKIIDDILIFKQRKLI